MPVAVISGDIVASTSLSDQGRTLIDESLKEVLVSLEEKFRTYGRMIKGDYIECVVPSAGDALRVALILKTLVKSMAVDQISQKEGHRRFKFFKTYGIRLAIGYGGLSRFDPGKGIIDGDAVYLSGRKVNEEGTHKKKRVTIKNTLFFVSANESLNREMDSLLMLIDVIISKATARQCEVLFLKLMDYREDAIALRMKIAQPVVSQHSTSAGWNAIEKAITRFKEVINSDQQK